MENDGHDKTVDTQDTSHNNGDKRLEDQVGLENTDGSDTNTGLSGTVGGTQVAEDEGSSDTHETEEGVLIGVVNYV